MSSHINSKNKNSQTLQTFIRFPQFNPDQVQQKEYIETKRWQDLA